MDKFTLVLGEENNVLPGKLWTEYSVEITEKEMICTAKKDQNTLVKIPFDSFTKAAGMDMITKSTFSGTSLIFSYAFNPWISPLFGLIGYTFPLYPPEMILSMII